jgi:YbbR domain-containing protein
MEIGNEPRREVEVTLSGPERLLQRVNSHDLVAFVDLSDYKAGDRLVSLTLDKITMGLPQGVRIDEIEPSNVPIRLELRTEASVAIESKVEGLVSDGYEVRGITVSPEKIRVRGPESHVANLKSAPTELIHLAGRKDTFTMPEVAIDISDRKINVLDPVVSVTVVIGEKRVEKTLSGVTVTSGGEGNPSPAVTTVMLYGPQSAINNLQASDIRVRLVEGDDGNVTPRLILPNGMNPDVELRGTRPSRFAKGK